jgi:hypothetical protein
LGTFKGNRKAMCKMRVLDRKTALVCQGHWVQSTEGLLSGERQGGYFERGLEVAPADGRWLSGEDTGGTEGS